MSNYTITREIGIDAGHRVMTHGSKCKSLHGHRYKIQATCSANILIPEGEQQEMVLDFGFLKQLMMDFIDYFCDHGMIMYHKDSLLVPAFLSDSQYNEMLPFLKEDGFVLRKSNMGKLYIVDFIPTAECLAEHWFNRLYAPVKQASDGYATLKSITVHETPNCKATYHG